MAEHKKRDNYFQQWEDDILIEEYQKKNWYAKNAHSHLPHRTIASIRNRIFYLKQMGRL